MGMPERVRSAHAVNGVSRRCVNTPGPADRKGIDMEDINVWRLTLECAHLRLDGPWDEDEQRHYVGDITWCELCPRVPAYAGARDQREMALRTVVNVERVPAEQYREAESRRARARQDQISEYPVDRLLEGRIDHPDYETARRP